MLKLSHFSHAVLLLLLLRVVRPIRRKRLCFFFFSCRILFGFVLFYWVWTRCGFGSDSVDLKSPEGNKEWLPVLFFRSGSLSLPGSVWWFYTCKPARLTPDHVHSTSLHVLSHPAVFSPSTLFHCYEICFKLSAKLFFLSKNERFGPRS